MAQLTSEQIVAACVDASARLALVAASRVGLELRKDALVVHTELAGFPLAEFEAIGQLKTLQPAIEGRLADGDLEARILEHQAGRQSMHKLGALGGTGDTLELQPFGSDALEFHPGTLETIGER